MPIVRFFGSLRFAIFLIATLALTLSASTVLESVYGTPFAQKNFYTAHWFDFFLGLFWINIFCSTLTRYPFKKSHIGFIVTHIGILTLLTGAFLSRAWGAEGQMTIYENTTKNEIIQPGFLLTVSDAGGRKEVFNLKNKAQRLPSPIPLKNKKTRLSIAEVIEQAAETRFLIESDTPEPNAAVHLSLSSALMGFNQKFTLIAHDPGNPGSATKEVGPARFILRKNSSGASINDPVTKLIIKTAGRKPFEMELNDTLKSEIPITGSNLRITSIRYYSFAKVVENKLVNAPSEAPFNPAVEFQVADDRGRKEFHTKFLIFPDFASLRGGKSADFFHLDVALQASFPGEETPAGASFLIYPSTDKSWLYEIYSSKGLLKKGELKLHDKIETGWRDITIDVLQMFNHAEIIKKIKKSEENSAGFFATRIIRDEQGREQNTWLTENTPADIRVNDDNLHLSLEPVKAGLPFELTLKDFRKKDYPGTSSPASFESDVKLFDPKKQITVEKTIRMNQPLDYAGFRVFQSSYIQDPELGEASVFTIAKNPGIKLIYSGGVTILLGVILLFYFHPFFNPNIKKEDGGV